jgi:hypothetical protein
MISQSTCQTWRSGKAVQRLRQKLAGLNAQAKGRRLATFKPHEVKPEGARDKEKDEEFWVELLGRPVPVRNTDEGIRAVRGQQIIDSEGVKRCLESKSGDHLGAAWLAMDNLAQPFGPEELADRAYSWYERFRPWIPEDIRGCGANGVLGLELIERLARNKG